MKRLPGPIALALAAAALVAASPSYGATHAARATFCKPRASRVLASAHGVRVIRVSYPSKADEYGTPVNVYACFPSKRRRVALERFDSSDLWTPQIVKITPKFVAYAATIDNVACEKYAQDNCMSSSVTVRTLSSGRRRCYASSPADALALTSNGWAAWRVPGSSGTPSVLRACNSSGVQDLDSGDIDPASVRAAGNTVSWTRGGQPQSAVLR